MVRSLCFVSVVLLVLCHAAWVFAQTGGGSTYYDLGVFAYEDADYADAEQNFKKALELAPQNAVYRHYLGKTYLKMQRYEAAETHLERAWSLDAALPDLAYDLGFLAYKQSDYKAGTRYFDKVIKEEPTHVLANYYGGICLYQQKRYKKAAARLLTAAEKSPSLKVNAYYYAGICSYYSGEDGDALEKMRFVKTNTESESLQASAAKWIERIESAGRERKPYSLYARLAYAYDDNVPLEPANQEDLFSDESDSIVTGYAQGKYNLINRRDLILGAGLSHYQTWHQELDEYDMTGTTFNLFSQFGGRPLSFGLSYQPALFRLDDEDYLLRHQIRPEMLWAVSRRSSLRFGYRYAINDFRQDDDRDGSTHRGTIDFVRRFAARGGYFLAGGGYEDNTADESDYDYGRWELKAGLSGDLFWKIRGSIIGQLVGKAYKNEDAFYGKTRDDARLGAFVTLSRNIYREWLGLSAEYSYIRNSSNIDDFDYTRQVVSLGVTAKF